MGKLKLKPLLPGSSGCVDSHVEELGTNLPCLIGNTLHKFGTPKGLSFCVKVNKTKKS